MVTMDQYPADRRRVTWIKNASIYSEKRNRTVACRGNVTLSKELTNHSLQIGGRTGGAGTIRRLHSAKIKVRDSVNVLPKDYSLANLSNC